MVIALILPIFLAFGALAVDGALWLALKRHVQTAADATALAAARTGGNWPITVARDTARVNGVDVINDTETRLTLCGADHPKGDCNQEEYEVEISRPAPLLLSAFWVDDSITVRARAVAVRLPCGGGKGINSSNGHARRDRGLTGNGSKGTGLAGSDVRPANAENQGHEKGNARNRGKGRIDQGPANAGCAGGARVRLIQ